MLKPKSKAMDPHAFTKQAEELQTKVFCLLESWWQLFSGTGKEY
jgi:hypothetical protein